MFIFYLSKAWNKIKSNLLKVANENEMGGILIGYKLLFARIVVDVTVASSVEENKKFSFVLNGSFHEKQMDKIVCKYWLPPSVIGLWHSHVNGIRTFSFQDIESNDIMAKNFGSIISAIATINLQNNQFDISTYFVQQNMDEKKCVAFTGGLSPEKSDKICSYVTDKD